MLDNRVRSGVSISVRFVGRISRNSRPLHEGSYGRLDFVVKISI